MACRNMQGHMKDKLLTNDRYIRVQPIDRMDLYESTLCSTTLSVSERIGLRIHKSRVAQDTLRSIYGKTTQLQTTL